MNKYDQFKHEVWQYYNLNARNHLPWRTTNTAGLINPYHIFISEIMLQQTQVDRVLPKYVDFIERFPDIDDLASTDMIEILRIWNGLGYNRRAKYLHESARIMKLQYNSEVPDKIEQLVALPGVGINTAGAILAYAYNKPVDFIETNIRTVYMHHFFPGDERVSDKEILAILKNTKDIQNPREWYWALMDYGTYLKKMGTSYTQKSLHYTKQSKFKGSKREIRGMVLKALLEGKKDIHQLKDKIRDKRLFDVLNELEKEQMIASNGTIYKVK